MKIRLIRATNFRLLTDVTVRLSVDPARPLTVVRGENGSGKTTLHYATIWCLFGIEGVKAVATDTTEPKSGSPFSFRLSSKASPTGVPVMIEVAIEFEVTDQGGTAVYRLRRTVQETPQAENTFTQSRENVTLSRLTPAGDEILEQPQAWMEQWLPRRLADVFFTDGDAVQKFISGRQETRERQEKVHRAIESLLGIKQLRLAVEDITEAHAALVRKAARSAGGTTEKLSEECDQLTKARDSIKEQYDRKLAALKNMEADEERKTRELEEFQGIGDLDSLNSEIRGINKELDALRSATAANTTAMADLLIGQSASKGLAGAVFDAGLSRLDELADRRVIPNTSVQVLVDRLEEQVCICGHDLSPGTDCRLHVEGLLAEQRNNSEMSELLTALRHQARTLRDYTETPDFKQTRSDLLGKHAALQADIRRKSIELNTAIERRERIDHVKVRQLTSDLKDLKRKKTEISFDLGSLENKRELAEQQLEAKKDQLLKAQRTASIAADVAIKRDVGGDLLYLAEAVRAELEEAYVKKLTDQLDRTFRSVVGSADNEAREVFSQVQITDKFDIVVNSWQDTNLDPDFEINGASRRALTLSFIWSLMEVAGTEAPRFIDTPLGMVSGARKRRLVDAITQPVGDNETPYQVVLLLTPSEIAGVEDLLDERAGAFATVSFNGHHPDDLVYSWSQDVPCSRICECSHRQECRTCARKHDSGQKLDFIDREEES